MTLWSLISISIWELILIFVLEKNKYFLRVIWAPRCQQFTQNIFSFFQITISEIDYEYELFYILEAHS